MRLNRREAIVVAFGALAVALVVVWQAYLNDAFNRVRTLRRVIPERRAALAELERWGSEAGRLREQAERLRRGLDERSEGFSLLSFVEEAARDAGLGTHIARIQPSTTALDGDWLQSTAEIELEAVRLDALIIFLEAIESDHYLTTIRYLRIGASRGAPQRLDAVVQVGTLAKRNASGAPELAAAVP